jgi:multidrug efflux system outer membrane protein
VALAAATLASRGESRRLIAARRDVGLAGDLDVLAAEAAMQTTRAELANLTRQAAAAENALRLLVGSSPVLPSGAMLEQQALVAQVPVGLPAEVLLRRPDVLAAEQRLQAANANVGAARAAFLPRILLTAALGTASRSLAGLFDAGSGAWSFNPVLRYPLFDAGAARAMSDLAEARKSIAVADYEKTLQQAFREIADLLAAREQYAEQLAAQEAATKAQGERQRMVEARHTAGLVELPRTARRAARILRRATVGAGDTALAACQHRQPVQGPGPVLDLQRPLDRQRAADLAFAVAGGLVVGVQLGQLGLRPWRRSCPRCRGS